ncbi:MAG: Phosphoglycolate phosphatase [Gemmatimonadaceae bacterium]|nr:Phosphoglycolate phosphatase [Gemmatimonadaceae bacterium]
MRLVLFDIDGTLLSSHGAGRRAMEFALQEHFGTPGSASYRYDGHTDRQIVRDQMRAAGIGEPTIDARLPALERTYLERLQLELMTTPVTVEPGVLALLEVLESRADRVIGLLTGNLEPGASAKLHAAGIEPTRFRVGAYGSDGEVRGELPAIAQERARERLGLDVPGDNVILVGDTPSDIACGRGVGARVIAVATGNFTVAELAALEPAYVFPDLSDTAAVLDAIANA